MDFWDGNHDASFVGNAAIASGYVAGYTGKDDSNTYVHDLDTAVTKVARLYIYCGITYYCF